MKRKVMALLLGAIICATGTACGSANSENTQEMQATEGVTEAPAEESSAEAFVEESATEETAAESATEATSEETTEKEDASTDASTDEKVSSIEGTWQTVSMVPGEDDEDVQPEFYVQFADSEIQYGHMENDEFAIDHADKIESIEQTANGGYKVQAESENGVQYTFMTSEDDNSILEYYETWNEDEFSEKYSGSGSLIKAE